jgi:hypothetical protein
VVEVALVGLDREGDDAENVADDASQGNHHLDGEGSISSFKSMFRKFKRFEPIKAILIKKYYKRNAILENYIKTANTVKIINASYTGRGNTIRLILFNTHFVRFRSLS